MLSIYQILFVKTKKYRMLMCPILFMLVGSISSVMTLGIIDKFELFKFVSAFSELKLISIIQITFERMQTT